MPIQIEYNPFPFNKKFKIFSDNKLLVESNFWGFPTWWGFNVGDDYYRFKANWEGCSIFQNDELIAKAQIADFFHSMVKFKIFSFKFRLYIDKEQIELFPYGPNIFLNQIYFSDKNDLTFFKAEKIKQRNPFKRKFAVINPNNINVDPVVAAILILLYRLAYFH